MSETVVFDKMLTIGSDVRRVEIDTSLPFESVKDAVNLFGEKAELLKQEKPKDVELKQELVKLQGQLTDEERRRETALYELDQAKKLLEQLKNEISDLNGGSEGCLQGYSMIVGNEDTSGGTSSNAEEIQREVNKLESFKEKLRDLKTEFLDTVQERDAAVEQREKILASIRIETEETEVLNQEIANMNESLVLLKLACIEANRDKVSLLGGNTGPGIELELANDDLKKAEIEQMLVEAMKEIASVETEIENIREGEAKAKDAGDTLERSELEEAEVSEESLSSSLLALSEELVEIKANFQKELDNIRSLTILQESLKKESEMRKEELKSMQEREANSIAAASVLTDELTRIKDELFIASAEEARAVESISTLSQAFEQVTAESLEAKSEAESFVHAVMEAKKELEQAKAARITLESLLKEALQESELAKSAEKLAVDEVKSLSLKAFESRASGVDSGAGITISQDEYESLKRKVREAEELSEMKVEVAKAQIEAVRASEEEIVQKLASTKEDAESLRNAINESLHRAEMDEAARGAVENELKRLREREQKSAEKVKMMAMASQQQLRTKKAEDERRTSLSLQLSSLRGPQDLVNYDENSETVKTEKKMRLPSLKSFGSFISGGRGSQSSKLPTL